MATLSKQGTELDRVNALQYSISLRSNGTVLRNRGEGWKIVHLKEGISTETYWAKIKEKQANLSPEFLAYRRAVQAEFSLSNRSKYFVLVSMLGDDTDGICSSLQDEGIDCDLDTLGELDLLRKAWQAMKRLEAVEA
jgi:hypothetical protein